MNKMANNERINCCPICGRDPSVVRIKSIKEYGVEIKCNICLMHTGMHKTENEAIRKWNALTKAATKIMAKPKKERTITMELEPPELQSDRYVVRSRECGVGIEAYPTLRDAVVQLNILEQEDRVNGTYEPNFYEIWDDVKNEVVDPVDY